jgi:hypothetical protein
MDSFSKFVMQFRNARKALQCIADRMQLKSLRIARSQSQETLAYTVSIYLDGKRIARASNSGTGGGTIVHFESVEVRNTVESEVSRIMSRAIIAGEEVMPTYDLTHLVDDLVNEQDNKAWFRSWGRKMLREGKVAFLIETHNEVVGRSGFLGEAVPGTQAAVHADTIRQRGDRIVEVAGHPNFLLRINP